MAIYSLHHGAIGKTTHRPGTAGAHVAYVTRRRAASAVLAARMPIPAPGVAMATRAWFDAEEAASRKNGRVADKIMCALPRELDAAQRQALIGDFAEAATVGRAPWLAAIHDRGKDAHNPHVHIIVRDRDPLTGKRAVGLSEKGSTDRLRLLWEEHANRALAEAGAEARIDRRSLADRGIERVAEIHVGPRPLEMEARGVKPESRDRVDARGREIRWATEIDQGRTRAGRRAEIVAANQAATEARKWADDIVSDADGEFDDQSEAAAAVRGGAIKRGGSRADESGTRPEIDGRDLRDASRRDSDESRHRNDLGSLVADGGRAGPGDGSIGADRATDGGKVRGPESSADRDRAAARRAARIKAILARSRQATRDAERRTREHMDAIRAEALAALARATQPIEPPADVVRARATSARLGEESAARSRSAVDADYEAEAARRRRASVGGLWGWLTGRHAAANVAVHVAEEAASTAHALLREARARQARAARALAVRERLWEQLEADIKRGRATECRAAERRLLWLEACEATLRDHPTLGRRGVSAVEDETRRLAAARAVPRSNRPALRPPAPRPRPRPRYRPRGPRF